MAKSASILFVSTEVTPFAKTGNLADVANSLPLSLFNSGVEVRVVMPKYGFISDRRSRLHEVIRLKDIEVPMNGHIKKMNVRVGVLPDTRVQVYFIDNEEYFKRDSLYIDPKTQMDYADNHERFAFFNKAVFEMLKRLGWQPTIIHCNEWHSGLIPYYLKNEYKNDPFFVNTKSLFTIHNINYQGIFPAAAAETLDFLPTDITEDKVLHDGKLNFVKTGIVFADFLNTVSGYYAEELKKDEILTGGLSPFIKQRESVFSGIMNGIDYKVWDTENDKNITANFSFGVMSGKLECKKAIVEKQGLPFSETTPVLGIVTRLLEIKGIELMIESLPELLQKDVQVIFMGQGDEKYQKEIEAMKNKFPGKLGIIFSFDDQLAHMVIAGSDIFLAPSKFETCCTSQLCAMRYGTVPVVRNTGGLYDSVKDLGESPAKNANGFRFNEFSKIEFLATIDKAINVYNNNKDQWNILMKNGMNADNSWTAVAANYQALYKKMLKDK